ncbi:helix-turn-helix transcriptional regulator [Cellulomonas sp. SG140]|uniref:helix-turn-helix transcriptional regulator n=1 Tax=Cellulomonas sp. SG140 TaxID=2976536 RepID=UPI0021E83C2D|nr:helix-turn-helix domain-containing protein [Cellulomonas sp. SG140]
MSSLLPVAAPVDGAPSRAVDDLETRTRQRVLELIATDGPISAAELAASLDLTAAGVRRHLTALEQRGQIAPHTAAGTAPARRGRPARRFVVASRGQHDLEHRYAEIAAEALAFLASAAGAQAVEQFAAERVGDLERQIAPAVDAAGTDVAARAEALARALDDHGYAASARPVPGTEAVQLCQGHCPVQDVAAQFPQLCEAETRAFGHLLGVHVQRLATLTSGGHVCTTSIPTGTRRVPAAPTTPVIATEGPTA